MAEGFLHHARRDVLKSYIDTKTDSGKPLTRMFCGDCGSKLFAFTPLNEDIVSIVAGTLDDFDSWQPTKEQYCIHRLDFVEKMKGVDDQERHVAYVSRRAT